jgi:hypothetical protein
MCQSETIHQITDLFRVKKKKKEGKTNNDISDNTDSNNNNKCVGVMVSVKTVKINGKRFYKLLQFDTRLTILQILIGCL